MPERCFYFVVVSILFFNVEIFSQQKTSESIKLPIKSNTLANFEFENVSGSDWILNYRTKSLKKSSCDATINKAPHRLIVLSPSFYSERLSFFCRKELNLEKTTFVALRFRLGSLAYVNYLEQKPNAIKPF
jgi:hypothetical protein